MMAPVSVAFTVLSGRLSWAKRRRKHAVPYLLALAAFLLLPFTSTAGPASPPHGSPASGCQLHSAKGDIQHVIYLIFDNVHFLRDNPNVPSDLEQMPNLLNFIRSNGTLLTNDHTVLISHTANGILTSASSSLNFGVESFQFHAGIFNAELPVDPALFGIRLVRPGCNFSL